tara:strand:+ start:229 stop:792 length:564 start_codon:yes stop_codon:yes gene_type:complete
MTTFKSSTRIMRAPGTVIAGPTSLTAGSTGEYGGEIIGSTRAVALVPLGTSYRVECEGIGEFSDVLEGNNRYLVNFFLRGWDKMAVAKLLAGGYSVGSVTGNAVWKEPGTKTPGQTATTRALVWLFVPDDTTNHPALIIRAGIPDFADGAELAFQRGEEFGLDVSLECIQDSDGDILDMGMLEDLSL